MARWQSAGSILQQHPPPATQWCTVPASRQENQGGLSRQGKFPRAPRSMQARRGGGKQRRQWASMEMGENQQQTTKRGVEQIYSVTPPNHQSSSVGARPPLFCGDTERENGRDARPNPGETSHGDGEGDPWRVAVTRNWEGGNVVLGNVGQTRAGEPEREQGAGGEGDRWRVWRRARANEMNHSAE